MPLPNILEFIGNSVTQAGFKTALEKLLIYLNVEGATKAELNAAVTPKADKTYVDSALTSFQNGAIKTYPTLAAANADIANIALNTKVSVLSETDGGDYYKASASATSLTKSAYDPLTQAKIDATTKADNAEANAKSYTNDISTDTVQFSAEKIKIFTGSYNLTTNTIETYPSWKSFKYKLSGKEIRISGKFAAHYNGLNGTANNIKLPAISFFDKDAKLISYLMPTDSANGKAYDLAVDVPKNADYVLLNYCTASVNNLPANMSGYGIVTVLTEKTLSKSTDVNALTLVQQNGLVETNEETILLNNVAKNPNILTGKDGVYTFGSVYQNWFSHQISLENVQSISGLVSAYRFNADSVYLPAIVVYDVNNNVLAYVDPAVDINSIIEVNINVTSQMSYAILNTNLTDSMPFIKLTKKTGAESVSKLINDMRFYLNENGNVDSKTYSEVLTNIVNDETVFVGTNGSYAKQGVFAKWYCKKIDLTNVNHLTVSCCGYNDIPPNPIRLPALVIFDSNDQVVSYVDVSEATGKTPFSGDFTITENMAYAYVQYFIDVENQYFKVAYSDTASRSVSKRLEILEAGSESVNDLDLLHPVIVYTVANDIDYKIAGQSYTGARSALKRNFSAVLHLDNFIQYVNKEHNITFEDKNIIKVIPPYAPVINDGAIENPNLNGGNNIYQEYINYSVLNNKVTDLNKQVVNRCTLNSASKDKVPTILVIGDSVSFGQDAYFSGGTEKWNYTMILNKMFMNDRAQNGGIGYGFRTVGTIAYTDKDGNKSFNEAYSGQTLQGNGLFTNSKFLDSNNAFSFQNWLDKYRTCDDSGNRLYFNTSGATTGTAGTNNIGYLADGSVTSLKIGSLVSNTLSHDVYAPTHVFCFHASNATIGVSDYNLFISRVRAVFPNAVIGLGVPHVAGTYFPSKYPNVYRPAIWQYDQTYNNRHVTTMQTLINNFWNSTQEANKVFVLPTFWVNPSVDAFSSIKVNNPYADVIEAEETLTMAVGQRVDVHVGAKAQAAYAYQLYAWLKWTAANALF
ncbi:hypothetical protein ABTF33_05920 [Acinetobacter baumannii]